MPWGRGGPRAGAGAWVVEQEPGEMVRTTGRCGLPAQPVAATCSACGQRLGESPWALGSPRLLYPLGGGRVWPDSKKCSEAWRPG